jgi:hypothetical protein
MTRCEQGFKRSPLHAKDLSILDIGVLLLRLVMVFKDLGIRAETLQIRQAADMVTMPVGE